MDVQCRFTWIDSVICLLLAVVTLLPYVQTFSFGFVNIDDPGYVYENSLIKSGLTRESTSQAIFGFHQSNWHPLVWISYMLEVEIFGMNPGIMHTTNVILHIMNSLILYWWLRLATTDVIRSFLAALLFAIHPAHVESVAWITERKDVLSTLFLLITLVGYTRYCKNVGKSWYIASLIAFAVGLTAKGMLVTVPVVLMLMDIWPLNRLKRDGTLSTMLSSLRRLTIEKLPFVMLSAAVCVITIAAQKSGGAVRGLQELPIAERLANSLVSCTRYCIMTVWPLGLSVFYPMPKGGWPSGVIILSMLSLASVTTACLVFRTKRPAALVGWLWFLVTLLPVIGLVQVGVQSMADRYTYVSMIGLSLMLFWSIPDRFFRFDVLPAIGISIPFLILTVLTARQASYWNNSMSLFEHSLAVVPERNIVVFHGLPPLYNRERQYAKAVKVLQIALKTYDRDPLLWLHLGNAMMGLNQPTQAIACFQKAVQFDPVSSEALNNLGLLVCRTNNLEGMKYIQQAINADPDNAQAHNSLGNALVRHGDLRNAQASYLEAIRLGDLQEAKQNLAYILSLPEVDSAMKE